MREPRTGAADAALDLVEHEHGAGLITGFARCLQVARRCGHHPALAERRLEEHGRAVRIDRVAKCRRVPVWHEPDLHAERLERVANRALAGKAERAHGAAMEAVL